MPWTNLRRTGSSPGGPKAVAVFPFDPNLDESGQWRLQLNVGDVVVLLERETDTSWYLGHLLHNPGLLGVFPASYVAPLASEEDIPPVVHEISAALKEWNAIFKEKFLQGDGEIRMVKDLMRDVMTMRTSLMGGKMTMEETREMTMRATNKMDFLNNLLGLDLIVRNESGLVLSPEETSSVSLYRQHVKGSEEIKNMMQTKPREGNEKSNSFKIMMTVKNFVSSKVLEDVDLVISIYEASNETKTPKPLCENYIVHNWRRNPNDPTDIEKRNCLKVLYADISKNDITNKRLFLICNVVSEGNFSGKASAEVAYANKLAKSASKGDLRGLGGMGRRDGNFRKPVGVAAVEITDLFTFKTGKMSELGQESEVSAPFLAGGDNEPFESVFRKLVFEKKGAGSDARNLWVTLNVMMGDLTQPLDVPPQHRHSFVGGGRPPVARKIGLPEVILPSDFRNDLYVTLVSGEFSRLDKRSDRNVEVSVEVCDSDGRPIEESICGGTGTEPGDIFRSVVYYHEGKPRWNEVTKVTIPVEKFSRSHLRFTFRHRSSNMSKEKSPPWAMAFLKLVQDHDKTALRDGNHDLLLYKIEKKFEFEGAAYLQFPFLKANQYLFKKSSNYLNLLSKDSFNVQTTLCSTKLTQNEGLLSLLKWRDEPERLSETLGIFRQKVNGKEFVKFLPDVLDALFSILTENSDAEKYDKKVLTCLVNVIHLITEDSRFQQFVPVLDLYIQENFSATLAYNKLLVVLNEHVENASLNPNDLIQAMKSLKYIFKFVVQSRTLFARLNGGRGREPFQQLLRDVLHNLVKLMFSTTQDLFQAQAFCLRHMVQSVPDLVTVFDRKQLTEIIIQMVQSLPSGQLSEQKLATLKELVHSQLFTHAECRAVIMPELACRVRDTLESEHGQATLVPLCTATLGDMLDALHSYERERPGSTVDDVATVVLTTLRTVIKSVANRQRGDDNVEAVVSNMIGLFRAMTTSHYNQYIASFKVDTAGGRTDLLDFVMEVLGMFRDLMQNNVYSKDWVSMVLLQNSVLLGALRHIANTIRDFLKEPFESQAWSNFFQCAVTFITQPSLQLEKFSESKREKIQSTYKDMRKVMGTVVKSMWFNLGQQKIRFVPEMVGPFLEMTLIPETELRKDTIPIFFDMMQCEYYSPRARGEDGDPNESKRDSITIKGNFKEFEREIVVKLDTMIESGSGDQHYKALFKRIMMQHCSSHTTLNKSGESLVELVTKLMEFLLEYRLITTEDSIENQMSCIVNLMGFYQWIHYEELYLKYLKKLCGLHEFCGNWSEAAFTLLQFSDLLSWNDVALQGNNLWDRHKGCRTHRALKEQLYKEAIRSFEKGQMWERALQLCKQLIVQYEEQTYEYGKLEDLYNKMAGYYKSIMTEIRPDPEYFRVAFFGRGFPAFLQNKVFVYRGKGFERLPEFQSRIMDQFPNAELMKTLKPPTDEEKEGPDQLLQINKVDPIMGETKFHGKFVNQQIVNYYKVNEVNQFMYSRPFNKGKDKENEFASLWIERTRLKTKFSFPGVLQWFPLAQAEEVYELCPLENAIETMQKVNEDLRSLVLEHEGQNPQLNPLSMKLNGIIDAAVMGGTAKYEKAFFTDTYVDANPDHGDNIHVLKNLIAEQIPLLDAGIKIHGFKKTEDLNQLHNKLETMFNKLRREVEDKYGRRPCDIVVKRVGGGLRKSSVSNSSMEIRRSSNNSHDSGAGNNGSGSHHRVSAAPSSVNVDSRSSFLSQSSLDATPRSRMLSAIGITRKKSNASTRDEVSNRTSLTRSQHSAAAILENGGGLGDDGMSMHGNSMPGFNNGHHDLSSPKIVVTQQPTCRLFPSTSGRPNSHSRPSSGQYLLGNAIGGTPNHSRSPSITSNRDSLQGSEDPDEAGQIPPPVPPKNRNSDPENTSMSSFEEVGDRGEELVQTTRHILVPGKKKAPPPPPPTMNAATPPLPPNKPPLKLPE